MPKERNFNPVQVQRKADKAKAIKKGKADVVAARNERLAKKNPDRIRKQVEDLKAITEGGGKLTSHEEQVLAGLEKELKAVAKAREALGDKAPTFGNSGSSHHGHDRSDGFGKRRRYDFDESSTDSDGSQDVRSIPMPRDTPPPIPKKYLDEWYSKRRARNNANIEPLGGQRSSGRGEGRSEAPATAAATPITSTMSAPAAPARPVEAKMVYEAKPVIRDLQKEAVTAFMPTVVRRKIDKSRGKGGGLLEPEEADQLEREGYLSSSVPIPVTSSNNTGGQQNVLAQIPAAGKTGQHQTTVEDVDDDEG